MGWEVSRGLAPCLHPRSPQGTAFLNCGVLEMLQPWSGNSRPVGTVNLGKLTGPLSCHPHVDLEAVALPISMLGLLTASKLLSVWKALSLCSPLWGGSVLFSNRTLVPKLSFSV